MLVLTFGYGIGTGPPGAGVVHMPAISIGLRAGAVIGIGLLTVSDIWIEVLLIVTRRVPRKRLTFYWTRGEVLAALDLDRWM